MFCTVSDIEELLQIEITDPAQIAAAERAITEATAVIRNYCKQQLSLVEDDEITLDVAAPVYNLFLPELPVVEVTTVIEDDETLTAGRDEDYLLAQYGQLVRCSGRWKVGPQMVTVTYTHGYATIPDDIRGVCTRAAGRAFQAGLLAAESGGVPGIQAKSLGDFSVTYAGTSQAEGVLGVSGSRMLLLSEKDVLDHYRLKGA